MCGSHLDYVVQMMIPPKYNTKMEFASPNYLQKCITHGSSWVVLFKNWDLHFFQDGRRPPSWLTKKRLGRLRQTLQIWTQDVFRQLSGKFQLLHLISNYLIAIFLLIGRFHFLSAAILIMWSKWWLKIANNIRNGICPHQIAHNRCITQTPWVFY